MKPLKILTIILSCLWFSACSHTGSPEKAEPKKQESRESTSESRSASKETAESKPQETQDKSQSGQEASKESGKDNAGENRSASTDAAESKPQETRDKSQTSQTASKDAAESKPQEIQEKPQSSQMASKDAAESRLPEIQEKPQTSQTASKDTAKIKQKETETNRSTGQATSSKEADSKLKEARENLRISQETEKRIAAELDQLKKSGKASAEEINDYEIYHESVQSMVAENRKIVEKMEAAYAKHSPDEKTSSETESGALDKLQDPKIPEEQTLDEVAALDRRLNASLGEFDEKLLKEMDAIRAESADKMRDLAQEAAEAAKRLRESGVDVDASGTQAEESAAKDEKGEKGQGEGPESGKKAESEDSSTGTETASRDQSRDSGQGSSREEQGRRSYDDDDIVARQLREAAENETDPELKEKLWKEYEDYKKSTQ